MWGRIRISKCGWGRRRTSWQRELVRSRRLAQWISVPVLALLLGGAVRAQSDPRSYTARFVEQAPIIDGLLTTADEWSGASTASDGWTRLGGGEDPTNNRFAIVWNDEGLFMQHRVDYSAWQNRARNGIDFGYECLNLFFDPNSDGETNANDQRTDDGVDGYMIAFNQPLGTSTIGPSGVTTGIFTEAHVNNLFGSQGSPYSNFANLIMEQRTNVPDAYGYTELFIPWSDFDATDPDDGFDPAFDDIGLYHPEAPDDGEEWYFNVGRIQTDSRMPAWSSPSSATFLAVRPHGLLRFEREATVPCDLNGDATCDAKDIDDLSAAIRNQSIDPRYNVNSDQAVDLADHAYYINVVKNTYVGDANLDGQFNTSDLVKVFQVGEYEDGLAANSGWADGDWTADAEFSTTDFVAAFQSGGFELGPRAAVAAVPEPASAVLLWAIVLVGYRAGRMRRAGQAPAPARHHA